MTRKIGKTSKTSKADRDVLGPNVSGAGVLASWRGTSKPAKPPRASARVGVAYRLPRDLVERLARTTWHLQGPPTVLRAVDVIEAGLEHELARLEREHNRGRPFPPVPEGQRVRGGRRPGRGGAWDQLEGEMGDAARRMRERGRAKR